jgi:uncharacterized protein YutE (UPF0331/DUF86 family)
MMVDVTRLLRLLRTVTDEIAVLEAERTAEPDRRRDLLWLRGVKYAFVTAIEACIDAAQHVSATSGWGPPADNGDAMRLLGMHGVLDGPHADRMAKAVGFRNLLVHEYARVDDDIVVERLDDLDDLREYVRRMSSLAG